MDLKVAFLKCLQKKTQIKNSSTFTIEFAVQLLIHKFKRLKDNFFVPN